MEKNLKSKIINHKSSRVLVGMSGGVDSSVAAALLKKQGYDVIGAFLKFWSPSAKASGDKLCNRENKCCDYESLLAARAVCNQLKIPFYVFDVSREFKKKVVDYFIHEYDSGRTPNPCVVCNKKIKFGWMWEQAKKLGCDYVATGHYSRIARETPNPKSQIPNSKIKTNHKSEIINHKLFQAKDKKKDQSYFLWQLSQDQLAHILFPLGDYTKEKVRQMAKKWHLPTAEKKESQDLCFINTNTTDFLADYADKLNKQGGIVDTNGKILGQHRGLCYYTVGQREGLGVQLIAKEKLRIVDRKENNNMNVRQLQKDVRSIEAPQGLSMALATHFLQHDSQSYDKQLAISKKPKASFQPAYVVRLDVEKNQLVVGSKQDLNSCSLIANNINWINSPITNHQSPIANCQAKIRYGTTLVNCHIAKLPNCYNAPSKNNVTMEQCNNVTVKFDQPQKAITPGQSIVFYQKEKLIGGGIIEKTF